jgi:hypothetical protein
MRADLRFRVANHQVFQQLKERRFLLLVRRSIATTTRPTITNNSNADTVAVIPLAVRS